MLVKLFIRLWRGKQGSVAAIFGISAVPLVIASGAAVDMTQAYSVKIRLGAALDSAALAVGSSDPAKLTPAQLNQRLQNYYTANYPSASIGIPSAAAMAYDPVNSSIINFTASATVPTKFLRLIGINNLTVQVKNQVTRGIAGLELAIVLDNTGSMMCGDGGTGNCSQGVPPSHITTLKSDATAIVNTLFSNSIDISKLKIAIVPYVTAVNIGPAMNATGILGTYVPSTAGVYKDYNGTAIKNPNGNTNISFDSAQSTTTQQWKGCVVEPTSTNEDTTHIGPDITEPAGGWTGPWTPYYWIPTLSTYQTGFSGNTNYWVYKDTSASHTLHVSTPRYNVMDGNYISATSNSWGPNLSCPTPLVRLTNNQSTLTAATSGMTSWANSGTAVHVGMIWGWRALSPNAPFGDGLPYNTPQWIKAVVLETDGLNDIGADPDYTGFGLLSAGKLGTTSSTTTATAHLDSRLSTVCTNMKAAGIVIYTIGLGQGATSAPLQNCAGNGGAFFAAPTAAALSTAFQQIAASLDNLRLSK